MNILQKLLLKYPRKRWNWDSLSKNPNITMEFILNHPEFPWRHIANQNISLDDVFTNPQLDWDWQWLSYTMKITIEDVLDHLELWYWRELSMNPNIKLKDILDHPYSADGTKLSWDWNAISTVASLKDILDYPKLPWNFESFSWNDNITLEYIKNHPEMPWVWEGVSWNPNLTLDFVLANLRSADGTENNWLWQAISGNPGITFQDVLAHPELPWEWDAISGNPNVTLQDVLNHPEFPWVWHHISNRVGLHDIINHPELPWDWEWISFNPNLTMKFIEANIDKIVFRYLSANTFKSKWKIGNQIVDATMAMKPLNLPPYVMGHIMDYAMPGLTLYELMETVRPIIHPQTKRGDHPRI